MLYYYGEPNLLRALGEAGFWKRQEAEHAGLVPEVTPGLEPENARRLEEFGAELNRTEADAVRLSESLVRSKGAASRGLRAEALRFVRECAEQSERFVHLLEELLQESPAVRGSPPSVTVVKHMVRESEYFAGIARLILPA